MKLSLVVLAATVACASAMPMWWPAASQTPVSNDYIVAGTCPQTMSVSCPTQLGNGCCPNGQICGTGTNNCQKGFCCPAGGATCDTSICTGANDASWCKEQKVCSFGAICCSSGSTCSIWDDGSMGCRVSCFSGDSTVTTPNGKVAINEVKIGDSVLAFNVKTNQFEYSQVYAFLDLDKTSKVDFVVVTSTSGASISLTADHYIMATRAGAKAAFVPARNLVVGDLVSLANGEVVEVSTIETVAKVGQYSPVTVLGTVVVNDVVASCYAYVAHAKAHAAMAPLRWLWAATPSVLIEETPAEGPHWYATFLMKRFQGLLNM